MGDLEGEIITILKLEKTEINACVFVPLVLSSVCTYSVVVVHMFDDTTPYR